ncbi:hypothetical protein M3Y97_00552600 [Aphelenchoides bicaudatus]|nr:hypothetical protein M3Y97_00552600 [Aphelenchoides bicaudatus]
MSDDNKNTQHIGTTGVYGQLLGMATSAKNGEKMDPSIGPMKEDDRKWLENALNTFAIEADPVKKLKSLIAQLMNYEHETDEDLATLSNIVEVLIDLVCDLDFALNFCQLNGLNIIDDLLKRDDDEINQRIVPIIAEIAQNNKPVQQMILKTNMLRVLLTLAQNPLTSEKTLLKIVGAISSIVKGYPPAVILFCQLTGPDTIMEIFHNAAKTGNERLVHRCVVAIANIGSSAAPELIERLKVDVKKYLTEIQSMLEKDATKYAESLEYLASC